ncbi:MAG: hypothetical protein ACON4U_17470 [Myxococcota bacterium]
MSKFLLTFTLLFTACGVKLDDGEATDLDNLYIDPDGDEDEDGWTNGEELDQGTDPFNAYDVPYIGGWKKDSCRDEIDPTGNGIGDVAEDFGLVDQFGDRVSLHDFCNRVVLIEFAGFT